MGEEEEVVGRLKFQSRATNECRQCHGDSLHPHTAAMHAGGVAESSGPWNDDKDPFEVTSQHKAGPLLIPTPTTFYIDLALCQMI